MWHYSPSKVLSCAYRWWHWRPHRTQRVWMMDRSPIKVAACGRRWGKTEALAVECAALTALKPGCVQLVVAPTHAQARLLYERAADLCSQMPDVTVQRRETPWPHLRVGGSVLAARTAGRNGAGLRGGYADRIIVDEAAYVPDAVIAEVLMPMLADRQGQLVLLSTPNGMNHFFRWFSLGESAESRVRSFRFPTEANPAISTEFLHMQRRLLSARQYAVEYEALFCQSAGSVFSDAALQRAVSVYTQHRVTDGEHRLAGVDFGRYRDFTAVAALASCGPVYLVHWYGQLPQIGWSAQADLLCGLMSEHRVTSAACDATGVGDPVIEMVQQSLMQRRLPVRLWPVVMSAQAKRRMAERLAIGMEQGRLGIPDGGELLAQLRAYAASDLCAGGVRMEAAHGGHDDLVCALMLAWELTGASAGWSALSSE